MVSASRQLLAALAIGGFLALPCQGVNVGRAVISDSPNSGCNAPPLVETFATSAAALYVYFDVTGAAVGDVPNITVYAPGGAVYQTVSGNPVSTAGTACFSSRIAISGTPLASSPGIGVVNLNWNNVVLRSLLFGIGSQAGPLIHGVASGGSPLDPPVAGSIITVVGLGFAPGLLPRSATTIPLPKTLNGAQLLINGIQAPLFYVDDTQINAQVPWEASGSANLTLQVVTGSGGPTTTTPLSAIGPSIFVTVHNADGTRVTLNNPAVPGEYLVIYATGLGPVTNRPASGAAAQSSPISNTTQTATVTFGGVRAAVAFSGLTPGFAGLYQVNVQVPPGTPAGTDVAMTLQIGGGSTTQTIVVDAPAISPTTQLAGAFNFAGPYPAPDKVNWKDPAGRAITSTAYPGQIFLSVAAERMDVTAVTGLIKANKGVVIGQIPSAGLYWIQVAPGSEGAFISAVQSNPGVLFAGPNISVAAAVGPEVPIGSDGSQAPLIPVGPIAEFDLFGPSATQVCGFAHGGAVNTLLEAGGDAAAEYNVTVPAGASALGASMDLGAGIARAAQGSLDRRQKLTVNVSLQAGGQPNDGVDRSVCETNASAPVCSISGDGNYASWKTDEFTFLLGIAGMIHYMPANLRDNTVVVVAAGNSGLNLTREMNLIQTLLPNALPHMIVVGGADTRNQPFPGFNHSINPAMLYAPSVRVPIPQSASCTSDGTSFAAPQVARLAAQIGRDNPSLNSTQIVQAILSAATVVNGQRIFPTPAQVAAYLAAPNSLTMTPAALSFVALQGGSNPASQTSTASTLRGATIWANVSEPWLHYSWSGAVLTVSVNSTGMGPGTYTGVITIFGTGVPDATISVSFSIAPSIVQFTLTTSTTGTGSGTVTASPRGPAYGAGTVVTLTAVPAGGSTFAGWSGACTGTGACTVVMNTDKSVTATFNATSSGGGSLTGNWAGTWTLSFARCSSLTQSLTFNLTQTNNNITGSYRTVVTRVSDPQQCDPLGTVNNGSIVAGSITGNTVNLQTALGFDFKGTLTSTTISGTAGGPGIVGQFSVTKQ